jgi:hypothetical protein
VTGARPVTCPWRALYAPLVREVMEAMAFDENGNLAIALGSDPPAVLVDGIAVFKRAYAATQAEDMRIAALERKKT